jgi:hypothetical protein
MTTEKLRPKDYLTVRSAYFELHCWLMSLWFEKLIVGMSMEKLNSAVGYYSPLQMSHRNWRQIRCC